MTLEFPAVYLRQGRETDALHIFISPPWALIHSNTPPHSGKGRPTGNVVRDLTQNAKGVPRSTRLPFLRRPLRALRFPRFLFFPRPSKVGAKGCHECCDEWAEPIYP